LDKKKPIVSFFGAELLEAESVIHSMLKEYDGKKGEYDNIICFYFQILIARAIRNVTLREDADVIKKFSTIMRDVEAYIEKEYSAPIQTGDIAKNLFYSPAYFSRCVKKYSGKTYTELVQLKRIEKAGELLKNTKDSVETIAANVGFNDKKNFYKSFKRIYGCSPASYRGKRDSDNG
jgi:YesN/AraC family two-component response regulator